MKTENTDPDDLLGDIVPEINPEKLFDESEYVTLVIGGEENKKNNELFSDAVSVIISSKSLREEKDEALAFLKEKQGHAYLIQAIKKSKGDGQKRLLIAACWESGLDFSSYFPFFIDLVCSSDFAVSFEAYTVIQEMGNEIDISVLKESLLKLKNTESSHISITDTIKFIEDKLNQL